jgi:hypothetical protein
VSRWVLIGGVTVFIPMPHVLLTGLNSASTLLILFHVGQDFTAGKTINFFFSSPQVLIIPWDTFL